MIKAKEKYIQAYFQKFSDHGCSVDHTHKWSKVIRASGRQGKIFTANYTVLGLKGKVCINCTTFTKSNFELEELLRLYTISRINAGAPVLKRFETNNIAGDGSLWDWNFPELNHGVTPYQPPHANLPQARLNTDSYTYVTSKTQANGVLLAIISTLPNDRQKNTMV